MLHPDELSLKRFLNPTTRPISPSAWSVLFFFHVRIQHSVRYCAHAHVATRCKLAHNYCGPVTAQSRSAVRRWTRTDYYCIALLSHRDSTAKRKRLFEKSKLLQSLTARAVGVGSSLLATACASEGSWVTGKTVGSGSGRSLEEKPVR